MFATASAWRMSIIRRRCRVTTARSLCSSSRRFTPSRARHGRRVSQVDQRYRKRAEELLNSELSVALGIPLKEVPAYINQRIGKSEKKDGKENCRINGKKRGFVASFSVRQENKVFDSPFV